MICGDWKNQLIINYLCGRILIVKYLANKKLARVVGNILHNNPKLERDGIIVNNYKVYLDKYKL